MFDFLVESAVCTMKPTHGSFQKHYLMNMLLEDSEASRRAFLPNLPSWTLYSTYLRWTCRLYDYTSLAPRTLPFFFLLQPSSLQCFFLLLGISLVLLSHDQPK